MARDFKSRIDAVSAKLLVLTERYESMEQAYEAARQEIIMLKASLLAKDKEIDQLRTRAEYLTVASNLRGGSRSDLEQAKALIADLLRDVDRCIDDLIE